MKRRFQVKVHTANPLSSELLSIIVPACRNPERKNGKDWPPIHSREQSLQIIFIEWERIRFRYLTFSLRVLPALNLTTFVAGI